MAIVKMKKLHVVAMADQKQELLKELLHLGCVEISEPDDKLSDPAWSRLLERDHSGLVSTKNEIVDVNSALTAIRKYAEIKDGLFIKRHPITEQEFLSTSAAEDARRVAQEIGQHLQKLVQLQGEENRLLTKQASLEPWKPLDLPMEQTQAGTEHVLFRLMVCPGAVDLGEVKTDLSASDAAAELLEVSGEKHQRCALFICHRADEEAALEVLRPRGFSVTTFQDVEGTAEENLRQIAQELVENRNQQETETRAIIAFGEARDALRVYADRLNTEAEKERSAERLMTDGTIVFFEGWAPAEHLTQVEGLMNRLGCAWESLDPVEEEYPEVPVKLKNNWFTRPLNMVTEMYSLPAYNNLDPNPLMAPFFILFYGIMMADMGYGLLMMLAGFAITKYYRPKGTMGHMFSLVGLCGVSTFIMGAITGGFFGDSLTQIVKITTGRDFALPSLFTPLNDTLMILMGALALGVVQIITGMAISFIHKIKQGKVMDAIWEELTWWVVFAGIACSLLGVTNIVLYVGIVMILVGAGWNAKGFGKVTAVFGSLYNHITGYFGDILSYSRLMALMLAGSVIAQVFNTLGAIPGNLIIFLVISAVGNALNFALNLLSCYVHDLRLQCLEYFGKFYEDGGKPFRPLAFHTKYVDIENV